MKAKRCQLCGKTGLTYARDLCRKCHFRCKMNGTLLQYHQKKTGRPAHTEPLGVELVAHWVQCKLCGAKFQVKVWPGDKPPKYNICTRCKNAVAGGIEGDYVANISVRRS